MSKEEMIIYQREKKPIKAKLRLYLNDPMILEQLKSKALPIPLILDGEVVFGKTDKGSKHIFFTHDLDKSGKGFIPIFFDLVK
jgi:hypothetical protein